MELQNATVLVTGGSSGIGYATAKVLIEAGARVAITGRDEKKLYKAAEALHAVAIRADVANEVGVAFAATIVIDDNFEKIGLGGEIFVAARRALRPARYRPNRCLFRYRPFREIPRALATAFTRPPCSFRAALIISHSIRASVGSNFALRETASSAPLVSPRPKTGTAPRISGSSAFGVIVALGSESATIRSTSFCS